MDKKHYRVNWQAGMRLTDATFRSADEYHISRLQPLYSVLTSSGYGFTEAPIVRYEMNEDTISFTEIQASAITYSGKLILLSFNREERNLFQNIPIPEGTEPVIAFIDITSSKTITLPESQEGVSMCDADYQIILKRESEHYNNPDAVPFARFMYKHGWGADNTFIAPCINLRANGLLLRQAANYVSELNALIEALKSAKDSSQAIFVKSVIPVLAAISLEVEKESDAMSPRHFISLMQQGIYVLLSSSELEHGIMIPECEDCKAYVESHYTPYTTMFLANEGIRLTHALIGLPQSFHNNVMPESEHPMPRRPIHGEGSRERYKRPK